MTRAAVILGMAALASASPIHSSRFSANPKVSARDDLSDLMGDSDKWCKGWDLKTEDSAFEVWDRTGAGAQLDMYVDFVSDDGPRRWLKNLEQSVFKGMSGKTGADGCAIIGDTCAPGEPGKTCDDYFELEEETGGWGKNGYWIFQAAKGMHAKFTEMNRQLTEETLVSGFKIPQIMDDFDASADDNPELTAWLGASISMAGALGGIAHPSVGVGASIFGAIFSGVTSKDTSEDPDVSGVQNAVASMFDSASKHLSNTLKAAMGASDDESLLEGLPDMGGHNTLTTKIGKFFHGGFWLIENDEEAITGVMESARHNLKLKVVDTALQASKYKLLGDEDMPIDKCDRPGRQALMYKDVEYCFYLAWEEREGVWKEAKPEVYEKMAEHGIDNRVPYYKSIVDCARSGWETKQPDGANAAMGEVPTCFFNMEAKWVKYYEESTCDSLAILCDEKRETYAIE